MSGGGGSMSSSTPLFILKMLEIGFEFEGSTKFDQNVYHHTQFPKIHLPFLYVIYNYHLNIQLAELVSFLIHQPD